MTKKELSTLTPNQRVKMTKVSILKLKVSYIYGDVVKIYNGNWQVKVWFDGEKKPRIVGYTEIDLAL